MKLPDGRRLEKDLDKIITDDIESGRVGGASATVMQDGKLVYKNCFGFRSLEEKKDLTDDTIFRLASMTKPITAVAVLIQAEKGKLSVDMPVAELLPDFLHMNIAKQSEKFEIAGEAKKQITVEDLLAHKSGLGCMNAGNKQMADMTAADKKSIKTAVEYYEGMALDFEPGDMAMYSAVAAFDVLARLVELTSGMEFADFVKKYIFDPMELHDTTLTPTEEQRKRMIYMHDFKEGKATDVHMPAEHIFADFPPTYTCGGAGCVSTLNDYSRFAEMLLNNGVSGGRRIVSEEMIRQMQIPRPPKTDIPGGGRWGLGVRVNKGGYYERISEGAYGWSGAYGTHFRVDPASKITAVYMKNSMYDGGAGASTAARFEEAVYSALK